MDDSLAVVNLEILIYSVIYEFESLILVSAQESLDTLMAGRTTVIVAHRLSTVINADIIAVVKGGQIIDQGTHSELMKRGGFYASLVSRQMMDEGEEKEVSWLRRWYDGF